MHACTMINQITLIVLFKHLACFLAEFVSTNGIADEAQRVAQIRSILTEVNSASVKLMSYLFSMLSKILKHSSETSMNGESLC